MDAFVRFAPFLAVSVLLTARLDGQSPTARITLRGGPQAGTYDATGSPICKIFDSGADDHGFGAEFVADPPHGWRKGPPYLSHLWLSTPRMRSPTPDAVSFGVAGPNAAQASNLSGALPDLQQAIFRGRQDAVRNGKDDPLRRRSGRPRPSRWASVGCYPANDCPCSRTGDPLMRGFIRSDGPLVVAFLLAARLEAQMSKATFTLTGGPQAGSYEMNNASICETFGSGTEDHGFGADFLADPPHGWRKGPPYLSELSLRTPRLRNSKPDAVALRVTFTKWGTPETEIVYQVFTIPPALDPTPELGRKQTGKGRATVARAGGTFSATFSGETADGVRMEGTLECHQ